MKACFCGAPSIPAAAFLSLLLALTLPSLPAAARSFTVASTKDSGTGSLRQAILDANATAEADTITVTAAGVIALQSPLPTLAGTLTLVGPGTNRLVLDAGGARRVFATAAGSQVEVRQLTLAHGLVSGGAHGGAISNAGALVLRNVVLTNCQSVGALGGAIYSAPGSSLLATQVLFVANAARGEHGEDRGPGDSGGGGGGGGGLGGAVFSAGTTVFHACEFLCNSALGGDGGSGGAEGPFYAGGRGGGPNGGAGGLMDFAGTPASGTGGGGGGGGGTDFGFVDDGGAGALGGGGGGAGARRFGGSGGVGGPAGYFGGRGGDSCCLQAGGGGGGAGLGGALFAAREASVQLNACRFSRNLAWHGAGGVGAPQNGTGVDGTGAGGAVFAEEAGDLTLGQGNAFDGNAASTVFPDLTAGWIRVTSLANAGAGSLREALATAAAANVPTSIFVDATNGVLPLASTLVFPSGQTLLGGPGASRLTLSGSNAVGVLEVGAGATLALRGVTLAHGRTTNTAGAGLRNVGGRVLLDYCSIVSNQVFGIAGGGVYNSGTLQARQTRFLHNSVRGQNGVSRGFGTSGGGGGGSAGLGGGIFSEGLLHLDGCQISSNSVAGGHGGIGGESGFDYAGGAGGGPEGGPGGAGFRIAGSPGGFGSGGGGGGGGEDPELARGADGGASGFGGGGGGGGASSTDPLGSGGLGGVGGVGRFGGAGGVGTNSFAGGGGGGAGLGGGLFVRSGSVLLLNCTVRGNRATNGVGGAGGAAVFNGAPGKPGNGVGGGIFDLAGGVSLVDSILEGNEASSASPQQATGLPYEVTILADTTYITNPGPGTNVTLLALVTGLGPFDYHWYFLGQPVGTGQTLVISNYSLALAGLYQVVVTTPSGAMLSALKAVGARATPTPDAAPPILTLTAPASASTRVSSNTVRFAGTAKDPSGIAGVTITASAPGATPLLANGTTNWSAFVPLQPGTNVFTVVATDRAYNRSVAQTRTVYYAVSNRLKLTLLGPGSVLPNLDNQWLEVGKGYTLKATPAAGYVFRHWLAGTFPTETPVSQSPSYSFLMASNLSLQASFVPNPFPPAAGAYNGLFSEVDEARLERSGAVQLTVTTLGAFSGSLRTATKRFALSGQFNADGFATNTVPRTGTTPLTLELRVHLDGTGRVEGRVGDGTWSAPLEATLAPYNTTANPATNHLGSHTLALLWDDGRAGSAASVTVSSAGLTKLSGSLFDTASIAQQMAMDRTGSWPLFVPLYSGRGQLLGRIQFGTFGQDSLTGRVAWVKSTLPSSLSASRLAPKAFTNTLSAIGSRYPTPATNRVLNFSLGVVELDGGDLLAPFTNQVALSSGNVVTNLSPNPLSLTITKTSGLFSGKATEPGTNRTAGFKGVVLPQRGYGLGYFTGTNALGQVYFGPVAP